MGGKKQRHIGKANKKKVAQANRDSYLQCYAEFAKIEPESQPELAEEPAAPSEPIQLEPRQSEPSPRTRAGFDHPAPIVSNAHR